jgi:intein/homing endonuclease
VRQPAKREFMNQSLARIIAHVQADGTFRRRRNDGRLEIQYHNQSHLLIREFRADFKNVFGKKAWKPIVRKTAMTTGSGVQEAVSALVRYHLKNWRIPKEIVKSSRKNKIAYLRALYDDEGSVTLPRRVKFYSINAVGIRQVKKALSEFDVESHIYKPAKRNVFELDIGSKSSIVNFAKHIGFNSLEKKKKLKAIVDSITPLQ